MSRKEDKLKEQRGISIDKDNKFYQLIGKNCSKAISHNEVRQLLSGIKKTIREVVNE